MFNFRKLVAAAVALVSFGFAAPTMAQQTLSYPTNLSATVTTIECLEDGRNYTITKTIWWVWERRNNNCHIEVTAHYVEKAFAWRATVNVGAKTYVPVTFGNGWYGACNGEDEFAMLPIYAVVLQGYETILAKPWEKVCVNEQSESDLRNVTVLNAMVEMHNGNIYQYPGLVQLLRAAGR